MGEPPKQPDPVVLLGRVAAPFGVQGWIKIQPFTAEPSGLLEYTTLLVGPAQARVRREVEHSAVHGQTVLCKLTGSDTREQALAMKGWEIAVLRSELPEQGPDEFYWTDLLGLEVVNTEGVALGTIAEMVDNGAQSVMVVKDARPEGRDRLIPFVAVYVKTVSLEDRRVVVEWGEDF